MNLTAKVTEKRDTLSNLIRLMFGLAVVTWMLGQLNWAALLDNFRQIQMVWVLAAGLSFLLGLVLKLIRWRWLLSKATPNIGWFPLAQALFLGQAVNIIGLGRWGEVARVVWLRRASGASGVGLTASVVAEKLLDLAFLGLAASGWLWMAFSLLPPVNPSRLLLVSAVSMLALIFLGWAGQSLSRRGQSWVAAQTASVRAWASPRIAAVVDGLSGLTHQRQLGRGLLISAAIWAVMTLTNLLLLRAFGLPFSGRLALSVLVVGLLGVAANLTPANIGPYHWAVTLALTMFGVPQSTALAYAIVLHALITVTPLVIALILSGGQWPDRRAVDMPR